MTAEVLLKIASDEVGYLEKASNKELDDMTANAGKNDRTKYSRDLYNAGFFNGNKQACAWCSVFVHWCFYMMTGSKEATDQMLYTSDKLGAGVKYLAKYFKNNNAFYSEPEAGDLIFVNGFGHVGIVEKVEAGTVYTIEGNRDNSVCRYSYKLNSAGIDGYGRPKYFKPENKIIKQIEVIENELTKLKEMIKE